MVALDGVVVLAARRCFLQLVVLHADLVHERVARESSALDTLRLGEHRRPEVSVAPDPD